MRPFVPTTNTRATGIHQSFISVRIIVRLVIEAETISSCLNNLVIIHTLSTGHFLSARTPPVHRGARHTVGRTLAPRRTGTSWATPCACPDPPAAAFDPLFSPPVSHRWPRAALFCSLLATSVRFDGVHVQLFPRSPFPPKGRVCLGHLRPVKRHARHSLPGRR